MQGALEQVIETFVSYYTRRRHESLIKLAPADAYFGCDQAILSERRQIKGRSLMKPLAQPEAGCADFNLMGTILLVAITSASSNYSTTDTSWQCRLFVAAQRCLTPAGISQLKCLPSDLNVPAVALRSGHALIFVVVVHFLRSATIHMWPKEK